MALTEVVVEVEQKYLISRLIRVTLSRPGISVLSLLLQRHYSDQLLY